MSFQEVQSVDNFIVRSSRFDSLSRCFREPLQ